MSRFCLAILLGLGLLTALHANGIAVVDASTNTHLLTTTSQVAVNVESQIAVVKTTQVFLNDFPQSKIVKYAFPLPEGASAIDLRWKVNNQWYQADMAAEPPDTTLPGGGTPDPDLTAFLGATPLYFSIPQTVRRDSTLIVELTYVELLPYAFGDVQFRYPNDYTLIQGFPLQRQSLRFELTSPRTISAIVLQSGHPLTRIDNTGNTAVIETNLLSAVANEDYRIQYSLDLTQLGLFDFSTRIPDTLLPDTHGGFLTFIAEPDPTGTTDVINKVFTLIVDRSGSMTGNKIVQARDAASYIVNNLNSGDRFNIVDFSTNVTTLSRTHLPYTTMNRNVALTYIDGIVANGGTNISGAFDVAIPQFQASNDTTANIIIFFTDGIANGGITNTQQLVAHVQDLITQYEAGVTIFTFGIGSNVNQQLLTLLATSTNGLAEFLGNDDLFTRITAFYNQIRNPVLLNTAISFNPPVVTEVYPDPLPNLYKGQQMVVTGRYSQPGPVTVNLSGTAFGQPVSYEYPLTLADTAASQYQFLPKLWAKQKIEYLLVQYFSLDPNDPQAETLRGQIVALSLAYRVISPFTNFSGGDPTGIGDGDDIASSETVSAQGFELLGNYPNPFNPSTTIRVRVDKPFVGPMFIKIYNTLGQLVRVLRIDVSSPGLYEVQWDGRLASGDLAASGTYFMVVDLDDALQIGRMTLVR